MHDNAAFQPATHLRGHARFAAAAALALLLGGCKPAAKPIDGATVFVTSKQSVLRDRIAAVSNRTGVVTNGEQLKVLERARRFLKVRTPDGKEGWIEEKMTADAATAGRFDDLKQAHLHDRVIAEGTTADEVYLHASPGLDSERFFLLPENEPLSLLARATAVKPAPKGSAPLNTPRLPPKTDKDAPPPPPNPILSRTKGPHTLAAAEAAQAAGANGQPAAPPPPVMQNWWLVRDSKGDTGWIYGGMVNTITPDVLQRYAEGQRIVAAYILTRVDDPESGVVNAGQPVTQIPEYITAMAPPKGALPYDFDQVRVFIWNVKKHRYETSFRQRNIAGYLPVEIGTSRDQYGKGELAQLALPSFTVRVLPANAPFPQPDPVTGIVKPAHLITKTYRLEGNLTRRLLPPNTQPPEEMHPVPEEPKEAKGKRRR